MADENQALTDRVNALSGGAPLPQAATMTIAKRLLGPQLAQRYGDVIGARPTGIQDVARDLAIGTMSGDPTKADQLKLRVQQTYQQTLRDSEQAARQREADARTQINGFFELLKQGKTVPKELRKDFFKEALPKIGIEPTSSVFLKLLTDDKLGSAYDALSDPDLHQAMLNDPLAAVEKMIASGPDGSIALGVVQSVQQMKRYKADTDRIIADTTRKTASLETDPNAKYRETLFTQLMRPTKDRLGRSVQRTAEEARAIANKSYPPKGTAVGIAQAPTPAAPAPLVPSPNASPVASTPTTDTPTTDTPSTAEAPPAPVGIPQAPLPTAAEGQQKVRRITGTVTKVQ